MFEEGHDGRKIKHARGSVESVGRVAHHIL